MDKITNAEPVISSLNGYCIDNVLWQHRVFPFWMRNERRGMSSYHRSLCLQWSQCDLLVRTSSPLGNRSASTLINDPIKSPKMKSDTSIIDTWSKTNVVKTYIFRNITILFKEYIKEYVHHNPAYRKHPTPSNPVSQNIRPCKVDFQDFQGATLQGFIFF